MARDDVDGMGHTPRTRHSRKQINKADYSHGKGIGDSTLVVENESLQSGHWLGGERPQP